MCCDHSTYLQQISLVIHILVSSRAALIIITTASVISPCNHKERWQMLNEMAKPMGHYRTHAATALSYDAINAYWMTLFVPKLHVQEYAN